MSDDSVYVRHIRDALADISTYTNTGRDAFFAERMRQDAILRKLEVIGQAVKNLSDATRSREPEIPWKQIAGMRDKVIQDAASSSEENRSGQMAKSAQNTIALCT